ncbi:MAG: winged helix-turn-helix domain-containing protein [Christensenellaceae bacterium]|nr:winged helix-turn-helix domain-containing protein [Christensenellaceae bacterium]
MDGYEVLQARVEAMFRNVEQIPKTITRGLLTLKLASREAFVDGVDVLLTSKGYTLLQFFIQNENSVMSADYVYESLWGQPMAGDSNALDIAVLRLRKNKLSGCCYTISTEYGNGYRFERRES